MKIYRKFKGEHRWFTELGFRIAANDLLNDLRHAVDEYKKVHEMKPQRIQLSRKKGFRFPPDTVVVARPSCWGNPHVIGFCPLCNKVHDRAEAVAKHREEILWNKDFLKSAIAPLRGKNLACWCPIGEPCHADVLLEIANQPDAGPK